MCISGAKSNGISASRVLDDKSGWDCSRFRALAFPALYKQQGVCTGRQFATGGPASLVDHLHGHRRSNATAGFSDLVSWLFIAILLLRGI